MKPVLLSNLDIAEGRPVDPLTRVDLLCLLVSALLWLVTGTALGLIHLAQLHTPAFFASHEWLSFGRAQAAAETALLYGWGGNAMYAVAFWVLYRLGAAEPRGLRLKFAGFLFWNLGVSTGVVGILMGDLSGFPVLQMPAYVYPLLLAASVALGTSGALAWADRKQVLAHAAQWYAVAPLFLAPWIFSVAALMLFCTAQAGVLPEIVASWCGSNLLSLWLAPTGLAALYYLIPKLTGRLLHNYGWALGGFWVLVVFAPWSGTRVLSGGPFPVWIPTLGIAAALVLCIHYVIVAVNLRSSVAHLSAGLEIKLLALAAVCYVLNGLLDAVSSLRSAALWLQFTYWMEARFYLFLFGFLSPALVAAITHMVPRLLGRPWPSLGLAVLHWRALSLGLLLLLIGLGGLGIEQALALSDTELLFAEMTPYFKPWLLCATGGIGLQLLGSVLLFVNLLLALEPRR